MKNGKCTFCGERPQRTINTQLAVQVDKAGSIVAVVPRRMVDYAYYECICGMRYTPQEMGEEGL